MQVWVDGDLLEEQQARVSVFDHGFTVADGVFETLKVEHGRPFALTRHLERLASSARGMGLADPDLGAVRHAVETTLEANRADLGSFGRLRITVTSGAGPLGSDRADSTPTLVVAVSRVDPWPASAAVITVPWPRNERSPLAGVKSTSYAENVIALAAARRSGASEALLSDTQGRLCEGTGSNVIVELDGRLVTPTLATGALPGITRALVLQWCDVVEVDVPIEILSEASGMLLTSSTRDVQPVHSVDGRRLDPGRELLRACVERFRQQAALDLDP